MTSGERFAKRLENAGLTVRRKGSGKGYVVVSPSGRIVGAFGITVEKGRTQKNVLAQIKRATGINA